MDSLIQKYNVPGPRYTSYPTVPFWQNDSLSIQDWKDTISLNLSLFDSNKVSLYIHLPYCESLCTFCGCHKRITKNHAVETPYIDAVLNEWKFYQELYDLEISELHLGGGTPTFFAPSELKRLVKGLIGGATIHPEEVEFSFEGHPKNTTKEHLQVLFNLGFRRVSFGVQDYDQKVQEAIHRVQSFESVQQVHNWALEVGYKSISHDLVFGLPKQHIEGLENTVRKTLQLMPDRVSLYSYAHVPWIKGNGQRGFDENDLPDNEEKRALYERAKELFLAAGYVEIGMDHFALPHDDLAQAFFNKTLHRNFMGYTTQKTNLLIGLGASSISDSWFGFAQNEKNVEDYLAAIEAKKIPVFRGHLLSKEDLIIRTCILQLMCQFSTELPEETDMHMRELRMEIMSKLKELEADQLIELKGNVLKVTQKGIPFVRNICMAFDVYLFDHKQDKPLFSKTI